MFHDYCLNSYVFIGDLTTGLGVAMVKTVIRTKYLGGEAKFA